MKNGYVGNAVADFGIKRFFINESAVITRPRNKSISRLLAAGLVAIGIVSQAHATLLSIRPINFVSGPDYSITATGTITTAGNTSAINDWNLTVTTNERLAHFTNANTANMSAGGISSDGLHLTVATSQDGIQDGGSLVFRASNPFLDFGVSVADFTGLNVNGGQAMYMAGGAFDFLDLNQPNALDYVAAQASGSSANLFDLVPLSFANGVTLSGTIKTDGTQGFLDLNNILAWDIYIDLATQDFFNPANSTLLADLVAMSPDGLDLTVNNPGGFLTFSKGSSGGHPYALQLADFSDQSPAGGQAGYFQGSLAVNTLDLQAENGPWTVTGTDPVTQPVPEPGTMLLLGTGIAGFAGTRIWGKKK